MSTGTQLIEQALSTLDLDLASAEKEVARLTRKLETALTEVEELSRLKAGLTADLNKLQP